jgi:hypothetical protein
MYLSYVLLIMRGYISIMYCRQRSTLRRLHFGPKDGEHLIFPELG